ncbi:MAG TPA: DUF1361 domain-containing protein [Chitinophagales bacterium]|nr:DUF1361 domain-containing protein [Chitinophagales bacterium]
MQRANHWRRAHPLLSIIFTKQKFTILLIALSAFGCLLLSLRILRTGDLYFLYLPWNLFLAWVPFLLSSRSYQNCLGGKPKLKSVLLWAVWFLFYPNAPYIITDLVHLGFSSAIPKWYDSLLVFSFALTGLLVGLASLYQMHRVIELYFGKITGWIFIITMLLASGFGIYIGRILRWNSWDLFIHTIPLLADVREHFLSPSAIVMTISFSLFTGIAYLLLFFMMHAPGRNVEMQSSNG